MSENEPEPGDASKEIEELPDRDYADPLEREGDDVLPGLDPAITIPPE